MTERLCRVLLLCLIVSLTASGLVAAEPRSSDAPWVLIDTSTYRIDVFQGERSLLSFDNFSVGRGGVGPDRQQGDNRTPLGEFRIRWVNLESRFHRFLGFDYPTYEHVRRGYEQGLISHEEYLELGSAARSGRVPRQDSRLGGYIGIHGLGPADPDLHDKVNWTRGCIALTDAEIEQLMNYVDIGTRVVVR